MFPLTEPMAAFGRAIPWPLLWLGASLGHAFWMTVGLNILYAWPLPHRVLRFTRKLDISLIVLAPFLFAITLDVFDERRLTWESPLRRGLSTYTLACFVLGTVVAPISQIRYWLRRTAPQQVASTSQIIDVVNRLGFAPIGQSRHARLCGMRINQVFQVEFTEKTLVLPQLPAAWDGLTILHLTDMHFCGTPDRSFFRYVFERALEGGQPDLVALTGDVVDSKWHHRWVLPLLGRVHGKEGKFAILGNHDHYRDVTLIRGRLRRAGFHVLINSWQQMMLRGQPLIVVGHEGPWQRPAPDLAGCPNDVFRLCLSHSPDTIGWARRNRIDLMLAGHVHGGQIRFPLIGSTFCPSRYSRRFDCGTFCEPPTVMHVSRGLAGQHPLRILCRPEVTRLILRKSP